MCFARKRASLLAMPDDVIRGALRRVRNLKYSLKAGEGRTLWIMTTNLSSVLATELAQIIDREITLHAVPGVTLGGDVRREVDSWPLFTGRSMRSFRVTSRGNKIYIRNRTSYAYFVEHAEKSPHKDKLRDWILANRRNFANILTVEIGSSNDENLQNRLAGASLKAVRESLVMSIEGTR